MPTASRVALLIATMVCVALAGCSNGDPGSAGQAEPVREAAPDHARLRAEAMLTRVPYPNLVVEVDFVKGREPTALAINALIETLEAVTEKDRIFLLDFQELPESDPRFSQDANWTDSTAYQVHEQYFDSGEAATTRYGSGPNATLHVLYLNGRGASSSGAESYGFQQYNAIYIFADRIRDGTPTENRDVPRVPNLAAERLERCILIHEAGHALGLVNHGAPMTHDRLSEDGRHSTNKESVMYLGIHGTYAFLDPVTGEESTPYRFDQHDLADLAAVRDAVQARASAATSR